MNDDSIGIELAGETIGKDPAYPGEGLYEAVTKKQNTSLAWLVEQL